MFVIAKLYNHIKKVVATNILLVFFANFAFKILIMKYKTVILFIFLFVISISIQAQNVYNVRQYGAKGNGINIDSNAFNMAIDACEVHGGGQVLVPAGIYLCGSIQLKSNVDLHLDAGAKIVAASGKMKLYNKSEAFKGIAYQDGGHTYFHNSLIWADGADHVSITGHGMIDGIGLTKKDTEEAGVIQGGSIGTGDKAIALKCCRNILIRDITIYRGGHFGIIITGCEIGTIDNITIDTNRDGIDIDCCQYITVINSKINTPTDDALCLKGSYALNRVTPCQHILITNCLVTGFKLGTFLNGTYVPEPVNWVCGRIKLGTESTSGYRDITINNCTCMYSSGLAFEEVDQGRMENINVSNIVMEHVHHYPIYITTGCRNRGPKRNDISYGGNISISHVIINDADSLAGIIVTGMQKEPLHNINFNDIIINYQGGGKKVNKPYREQGTNYPEPRWAGPTPAYGFFARHVKGLKINQLTITVNKHEERPAMILEDVTNSRIFNFDYPIEGKIKQIITKRCKDVHFIETTK